MNALFFIVNILLISGISYWFWKSTPSQNRFFFGTGLLVKLAAGLVVGLLYTYYYVGDTFIFFQDAAKISALARENFGEYMKFFFSDSVQIGLVNDQPRSLFFAGLVSIANLLTHDNYWVSSLWLSLISFSGVWYLFNQLNKFFPGAKIPSAIAFLYFPSVVLWSSGIIKESIAFAALCFLVGFFLSLYYKSKLRWNDFPVMLISIYLLWSLKYYWAAVLFPALVTALIVHWFMENRLRRIGQLLVGWLTVFALLVVAVSFLHPNFYPENFLVVIKENYDAFIRFSRPDNVIHYNKMEATWGSILMNSPWALVSGLFRPFVFESSTPTQLIGALENLLLLILFFYRFAGFKLPQAQHRSLVLAIVVYCVLLCTFLALSTPNFGTLSRYRIGFLPFFVFILLINSTLWNWKFLRK